MLFHLSITHTEYNWMDLEMRVYKICHSLLSFTSTSKVSGPWTYSNPNTFLILTLITEPWKFAMIVKKKEEAMTD